MASWSAQGVSIGQVDDALSELRRGEQRAATRISTINLVVVAEDEADAQRACSAMRRLGGRHPGRTVIIIPDPRGAPNVDAHVRLYQATVDVRPVWWEEVKIGVAGPVCAHLDSLVEPLTLGDLPLTVWYASEVPDPAEPLVGAADMVVVESPARPLPEGRSDSVLSPLLDLAQRRPLIDLSWIRLTPWRRLIATLFDAADLRDYAGLVDRAEVAGSPGETMLLGGWLCDRLELSGSAVVRRVAVDPAVELTASGRRGTATGPTGGGAARFSVVQEPQPARQPANGHGGGVLSAVAEIEGGLRRQDAVRLPDDPLAAGLAEALTCLGHDQIYERALGAASDTLR